MNKRIKKKRVKIPKIKTMRVHEDDTICVEINKTIPDNNIREIKNTLSNLFPKNKILVITNNAKLSILKHGGEQ